MELIIKGDGSVFRPFDKGYRNHLWRMRCGILWTAFYAALSGLRCLVFQPYTAARFVAIHPFDDGNGRLTRTITDMLLARADGMPHRYYSMSAEILRNKNGYYDALESTTIGDVDITLWLEWFLQTLKDAMELSVDIVSRVVKKSMFWQEHRDVAMNERQVKVVNRLWDGFDGKLTTVKWAKICKTSQATALRDINDLIEKGILVKGEEGSKNTSYILAEDQ